MKTSHYFYNLMIALSMLISTEGMAISTQANEDIVMFSAVSAAMPFDELARLQAVEEQLPRVIGGTPEFNELRVECYQIIREISQQKTRYIDRMDVLVEKYKVMPRGTPEFNEVLNEHKQIGQQLEKIGELEHKASKLWDRIEQKRFEDKSFVIRGQASTYALLSEMYPRYLQTLPKELVGSYPRQLSYDIIDSDKTIAQLLSRTTEIGIINRPLTDEERKGLEAFWPNEGPAPPVQLMFARAVTVVLVHPRNRVRKMTMEEVERAYREHGGTWKTFGGEDRTIERIGTTYPSLSWNMFTKHVLNYQRVTFPVDDVAPDPHRRQTTEDIMARGREQRSRFPGEGPFPRYNTDREAAEEVAKQVNAIGYCLLFADGKLPTGVRAMPLAAGDDQPAFPPTGEHILLGDYPLMETLYLVIRPDASARARAFSEFAVSKDAAPIIAELGLHPVTERASLLVARRVEAQRRGEGAKVTARGASNLRRLAMDLAMEQTKAVAPIQLEFGSNDGLAEFIEGRSELLLVAGEFSKLERDQNSARLESLKPQRITIGGQAVALIVHPENTTTSMTLDAIRSIFHGETVTWPDQAGVVGKINRYGLVNSLPPSALFYETAMVRRRKSKLEYKRENSEVISSVLFDKTGIGWVDVAELRPEQIFSESNPAGVRVVMIEADGKSVSPTPAAISNGEYPLSRPLYLYVSPTAGEAAKSLADFLRNADLQEVLRSHGFVQTR